jgi:hypothetical protein
VPSVALENRIVNTLISKVEYIKRQFRVYSVIGLEQRIQSTGMLTKRCLSFDRKRIKDFLIEYAKENSPTKIYSKLLISDSGDSSDSNFESLCTKFFSKTCVSNNHKLDEITVTSSTDIEELSRRMNEFEDVRDKNKGPEFSVTTVTTVTYPQANQKNIQKLYPHIDIWICKNCNDKGDIHYMRIHPCKSNNKK